MVAMSGHTPGLWTLTENQYGYGISADGKEILMTLDNDDIVEERANAKLACAAPELLAALNRLEMAARHRDTAMGDVCRLLDVKAELAAAAKHAREIIAQVEGRS